MQPWSAEETYFKNIQTFELKCTYIVIQNCCYGIYLYTAKPIYMDKIVS